MTLRLLAAAVRDLDQTLSMIDGRQTRAKAAGFIWPLNDAGYRAMERSLIDSLKAHYRLTEVELLQRIEQFIDDKFIANPELGINGAINSWVDYATNKIEDDDDLAAAIIAHATEAPGFGSREIAKALGMPFPKTSQWDQRIGDWLQRDVNFWIGDQYDYQLRKRLTKAGIEVLQQGLGRREMGRELKRQFGEVVKKSAYQWEVVGSSLTARGRHAGQIMSMVEMGVETWTWSAAMDERTCEICARLDGLVFQVQKSVEALDGLIALDPNRQSNIRDEIMNRSPWLSWDPSRTWTDGSGQAQQGSAYYKKPSTGATKQYLDGGLVDSAKLQGLGIGDTGQVHGGCRCGKLPGGDSGRTVSYPVRLPDAPRESSTKRYSKWEDVDNLDELVTMMENLNSSASYDFTDGDIQVLNPAMRQLHKLNIQFPEVAKRLKYVGTFRSEEKLLKLNQLDRINFSWIKKRYGLTSPDGEIIGLNPYYFGSLKAIEEQLKKDDKQVWHPRGCDRIEAPITHEFLHALDLWLRSLLGYSFLPVISDDGIGLVGLTFSRFIRSNYATKKVSLYALKDLEHPDIKIRGGADSFAEAGTQKLIAPKYWKTNLTEYHTAFDFIWKLLDLDHGGNAWLKDKNKVILISDLSPAEALPWEKKHDTIRRILNLLEE